MVVVAIEVGVHKYNNINPKKTLCGLLITDVYAAVMSDTMVDCQECLELMKTR